MFDQFNRKIDYLRISITDRCNARCIYCMPENGILQKVPKDILSFEEINRIVKLALNLGINKIKITGGEPLVRKDLARLLGLISCESALEDLSLTTNGILLAKFAKELKNAGLKRLNISLDSLNEQRFREITRLGELKDVLRGIDFSLKQGLPIKLNVVMMKGLNDNEILDFVKFAEERQIIIRFIELMPTLNSSKISQDLFVSCEEIKNKIALLGKLEAIEKTFGNGPANYFKIKGTSIIVGFISPMSNKFCFSCNRLRLTSDGFLLPCLGSNEGFNLKEVLGNRNDTDLQEALKKIIQFKPKEHHLSFSYNNDSFCAKYSRSQEFSMCSIGG